MPETTSTGQPGREITSRPPTYPEIATRPELRRAMVKTSTRTVRRALQRPREEQAIETIKQEIAGVKRGISEHFPDYPDEKIETLLDIGFGFGRLKKENVMDVEKNDLSQKEVSARIQHAMAHEILSASESDNPDYVETSYALVRNLATLSEGLHNQYGSNINMLWKGMRNELAILKVLQDNDYRVFLPDYAQNTAEVSERDNEVLQLDVKSGIDLIAVSPDGKILLIDAKGRQSKTEVEETKKKGRPQRVDTSRGMNPLVAETIVRIAQECGVDVGDTYKMKLVLHTEGRSFEPTDFNTHHHKDFHKQRESLKRFASVKPEVEDNLVRQLIF